MRRSEFIKQRREHWFSAGAGDPTLIAENEAKLAEWAGVNWEEETPLPRRLQLLRIGGRLEVVSSLHDCWLTAPATMCRLLQAMVDAYNRERRAEYDPESAT